MSVRNRFSKIDRVQFVPVGESLAQQSFQRDADINHLVNKHMCGPGRFGQPIGNPAASRQPIFGDFSSIDYHTMCNRVLDIQVMFRSLPARLRGRFSNDPYQLIRFVENPGNRKEAVKLGLILDEEITNLIADENQQSLIEAEALADAEAKAVAEEVAPQRSAKAAGRAGGLPQGDK